ncbi:MAG TPA: GAF domain-containing protein, partial [Vicinamibacterales bacterium]|nr:GAF domain-containing protein [Vicinamibacterales bacterium]
MLVAAREHLDMDVAYCSRVADEEVVRGVYGYGEGRSFELQPGTRISLDRSYAQRVIDGRLPNLIRDARSDGRTADLVPRAGSYVGVPLLFSDGRVYGMLCCASHAPAPWLRDRDAAFMRVLARMLADALERSEGDRVAQDHRNEAIALAALFAGLDARDSYTGRHSEAVVDLAARVTR